MSKMTIVVTILTVALLLAAIALPAVKMHSMLDGHWEGEEYDPQQFGVKSSRVSLTSADGVALTAYEVAVEEPQAVVICLGGIHSSTVTSWYGHSRLFADNGYASLLLDLRAHGKSDGRKIYAGTREWQDVDAAVEYISLQPRYEGVPIVVMGLSMGAATAVVSAGRNSNIDALISLSAYSEWGYNFNLNAEQVVPKWVAVALRPFVALVTKARFGSYSRISPVEELQNLGSRPALLVQAVGDRTVPYANFERLTAVAPTAEQWIVESDNHCIIDDFTNPQSDAAYTARILDFMSRHCRKR